MLQRLFRWFSGWSECPPWPKQDTLFVFGHTSYLDIFILWLYQNHNTFVLIRPLPWNLGHTLRPLLELLGLIEAGSIHDGHSGTTDRIVTKLVDAKLSRPNEPLYFLMSPKGTIENRPWKKGFYHIAKQLNMRIQAVQADFCDRTIQLGPIRTTDLTLDALVDVLQDDLGHAVPFRPERCEYALKKEPDPFELLTIVDLPLVTMWFAVPAWIQASLYATSWLPMCVAFLNIVVSFLYHQTHERRLAVLDATSSRFNIAMAFLYANHLDICTLGLLVASLAVYYAGTPRHFDGPRGRYVIYHSLFHILASWTAYRMYADTTHHRSNVLFLE
jgi:hypothetical protein